LTFLNKIVDWKNNSILIIIVNIAIFLISVLLLIYSILRATSLSFTIDESISYNVFVPLKFMDIVSFKIAIANNHMINTLFMKYISVLFGSNELLLRLPSILSHLVYIVFSYKIIKKIASPVILLAGFLLLNLNPYLLDFFSLARGYAMAVAFTVVSIYFLLNYIEFSKAKNITWSLIFAVLAVLSNFTLLIFFISLITVFNIYWIVSQSHYNLSEIIKKNIPVFICSIVLIIIMFEPIRKLIKFKEFYDGGTISFWSDTVGSLISASLYGQSYWLTAFLFIRYLIAFCSLILIITFVYKTYKTKLKIFNDKVSVTILLLFISILVPVAQHILLKSYFPINRMALVYIPLFFIPIILFISDAAKSYKMKLLILPVMLIFAGVVTYHTFRSLNTSYALYWKFDADTKNMLSDLEIRVKNDNKSSIKLGAMWLYEPAINYYRVAKKYTWLEKVRDDTYKNPDFDYYYLADTCLVYAKSLNKPVVKHYLTSNSYLVK
jgi:Dolichyl-phosphate-mannose-protein mannosyltransferase